MDLKRNQIPSDGNVLNHDVLETIEGGGLDGNDKRRVEVTSASVIRSAAQLPQIESGDVIYEDGEKFGEIEAISGDLSTCSGIHVTLDTFDEPVHLSLLQSALTNPRRDIEIVGERTTKRSELEGVDY